MGILHRGHTERCAPAAEPRWIPLQCPNHIDILESETIKITCYLLSISTKHCHGSVPASCFVSICKTSHFQDMARRVLLVLADAA